MTESLQARRELPAVSPVALLFYSLLILLAVFPPETRPESMIGCAVLAGIVLASAGPAVRLHALVVLAAALAWAAGRAAIAPGAAVTAWVAPLVAVGLAGAAALAARRYGLPALGAVVAGTGALVSIHGLYQRGYGLSRLAEAVAAMPDLPDRNAVLAKAEAGRAFAAFPTPAALGGFLALGIPITVGLALARRGRARFLWGFVAALQLLGLLATASASATAALLGALLVAAVVWRGRPLVWGGGALLLVLIIGGVAVQRGGPLVDPSDPDSPWRLRAGNMRVAWEISADHPWIGVGPGGYAESYSSYRNPGDNEARHAHDLPLELAAETGRPVALLLSAVFFLVFLGPLYSARSDTVLWRRGAAVGLAAFALHNLVDFTAFLPSVLWSAAILRGAVCPANDAAQPGGAGRRALAACAIGILVVGLGILSFDGVATDLRIRARTAAFAGEREQAERFAERAARFAPWDVDALLLEARTRDARDDTALATVERAITLSPVRASSRELRARLRLSRGDLPGAYADLREAARLHPVRSDYAAARDALGTRIDAMQRGEAAR